MKHVDPEFSRLLEVGRIPALGSHETVEATQDELAAVAKRLDLPALHSLTARLHVLPWRGGLKVRGSLRADIEQLSVVSLEQFRSKVEYDIERYFIAEKRASADSGEDADPIENGKIDIGEVVVETLALELDPYPRRAGEIFNLSESADDQQRPNPFDLLKQLKP